MVSHKGDGQWASWWNLCVKPTPFMQAQNNALELSKYFPYFILRMILSKTCLTCPANTLKLIYIIDLEENDTNIRVSLWKVTQALEPTKICIVRLIIKDKTYINTLGIIP